MGFEVRGGMEAGEGHELAQDLDPRPIGRFALLVADTRRVGYLGELNLDAELAHQAALAASCLARYEDTRIASAHGVEAISQSAELGLATDKRRRENAWLPGESLTAERRSHIGGRLIALERILGQEFQDDVFEFGRTWDQAAGRARQLVEVLLEDLDRCEAVEGGAAGEQVVSHRPERVEIGAPIYRAAADHLGSHVVRRAADWPAVPAARLHEAEIHELDIASRRHPEIGGLEVTVNEPLSVDVTDGVADLG
jgi:hypothetical protein